jgi:hypothetical protein
VAACATAGAAVRPTMVAAASATPAHLFRRGIVISTNFLVDVSQLFYGEQHVADARV